MLIRIRMRSVVLTVFAMFIVLMAGCGSSSPKGTINITFTSSSVAVGGTVQLHATDTNSLHVTTDVTSSATWSSSNPAIATINSSGLLAGVAPGSATISATFKQDKGSALFTVTGTTVAGLTLSPSNATVYLGGGQQYTATANSSDGTSADVTSTTTWSVTPNSVATISSSGTLSAVAAGTFTVTGVASGKTATTTGTVVPVALSSITITPSTATISGGNSQQFTASGTYNNGSVRDLTNTVTWASSNTDALTIDSAGLATTPTTSTPASVTVTATQTSSGSTIVGSASVQVTASARVQSLVVKPSSSSIATGSAEQHTATAFYSDGTQKDVTNSVTWTSSDSSTSAVNENGINTAGTPGSTTLQATIAQPNLLRGSAKAKSGAPNPKADADVVASSSVVIVTDARVTALDIKATRALFPIGAVQLVRLIGTFSDGSTQDLSLTANWTSSDPTVATIDSIGQATGVSAGDVTFSASFGGLSVSTTGFQVLPSTLIAASIAVDYPAQLNGLPEQLHFIGTYSDGTTHDITSLATFVSADPDIFATSPSGLAYGVASGSTQITGTALGFKAIIQLSCFNDPVSALRVFPASPRLALGTHLQFASQVIATDPATGEFFQDVTTPSQWVSSDPTVLTIDGNGVAKSGKVGTTTVSATLLGVTTFSDTVTVTAATLKRISIVQVLDTVAAGTGQYYAATGFFSDGSVQDITQDVLWDTSDHTIASIDDKGLALGVASGQVQVTAYLAGRIASTPLTVTDAKLASISLLPGNAELPINVYHQYSLIGTFSDGSTQDLTYGAIFQSPTPGIVAVYPQGQATGIFPGIGQISAQYGYFTASTPVKVTNAHATGLAFTPASASVRLGGSQLFTATGTFDDGYSQVLNGSVGFSSSAPLVAPATRSGLIYGTSLGSATITASIYGLTQTATLNVLSNVLSTINVTPAHAGVVSGSTLQLTATGVYDDGSTDDMTSRINWTSSSPALLSISASGLVTAVAGITSPTDITITGTAPATDAYPAITTSFTITIQPSGTGSGGGTTPPSSLTVTPTSAHLAAGTKKQLVAEGSYADGSSKDLSSAVTWISTNPSVATVSATGLVTAVKTGSASIQATIGSVTNSSIVIVSAATLESLAISPSGPNFAAGFTQQFTLTGTYSDGTTQDLSSSATWNTSNATVATISSSGLASAANPGPVQFMATFGGITVTSAVNHVTPAVLVSLAIDPSSPSFAKGSAQQLKVIGTYSDGSTEDLTGSASYFSSNNTVVSVSPEGLASGVGTGSAQITVTIGGKTVSTPSVTVTPAVLSSISITPKDASFANGTTAQFTVIGTFSDGTTEDLTRQAVWSSSDPQALTVDENGLATGGSVGSARITATFNGISQSTDPVNVTPATLQNLILSPTTAQIAKNTSQQFTATGVFTDGTTQNLSSTVAWSTSDGQVVSVDANGLATGNGSGTAQLTASYLGRSVSTSGFTVTPATLVSLSFSPSQPTIASGTGGKISVIGTYSDGTTQDLTSTATFSSSNTLVAMVGSGGTITGGVPGTATITVVAGGQSSSFDVTVSAAVLSSLVITPATPAAFAKGTTQQFTATGTFSDGSTQDLSSSVTWVSSDTSVFTIDANGLATGMGVGSASLTATYQGQTASTSTFQVTPATVASVAVAPQNVSVAAGGAQQFTATATYTDSTMADVSSTVQWSSSDTTIATVNSTGLATAVAAGASTISAQLNGKSGTAALTVTAAGNTPVLQQINVAPRSSTSTRNTIRAMANAMAVHPRTAAPGATQQFIATGIYSDESTRDVTTQVAWSSSVPSVATINATGLASAVSPGTTSIQAQLNGLVGSANFTVAQTTAALQSITIKPAASSIAKGTAQQFTASGTYSDGSSQDITNQVTWQSSVPSVATIDNAGLATGLLGGNTQISASLSGRTTVATLTVSPATLSTLAVTPQSASIANGTTQQYKAMGTLSDGSTQDLTNSVTWSTSSALASINASGLAVAAGTGSVTVTAAAGGASNAATLTISAARVNSIQISPTSLSVPTGETQQLLVTANFSDGSSQNVSSAATYASSNPSVVSVDSNGVLRAVGPGSATVTITLQGTTTTLTVTVGAATIRSIAVTPNNPSIASGNSQQLTATATYSDGSTQDITNSVTWASSNTSTATVSPTGNIIAAQQGAATITATIGGTTGTVSLTVTAAVATAVSVSPAGITLAAGQTRQFAATATMSDGTQQNVTASAHWAVSDPSKATINDSGSAKGTMTGTTAGTVTVSATLNGVSGTAAVTIETATLTSLTINPSAVLSLPAGTTKQLSVTGTYSDGSNADVTAAVTWSTSQASTAFVDVSSVLHGVASGTTTINAVLQGVTGTSVVTVGNATLTSITIAPTSPVLALGQTGQLTATGHYSDLSTADITSQVQWSSSKPAVATISGTGLVSALGTGGATLTAALNGVSQTAPLTVTSAVLQSISVQSPSASFALGTSLQLKAVGLYSDGSTQDLTNTVAWSSSNPSVGVVSNSGVASGVTTGSFVARATSNGITGTQAITVNNATLVSIAVTPSNTIIANVVGAIVQYTATGTFTDGSTQNLTKSVHWAMTGIVVGSISPNGVFSPTGVGVGTVTATSGSVTGSTSVIVVSVPII